MAETFLKKLFRSWAAPRRAAPAQTQLSIFGKHPAWDDHIPYDLLPEHRHLAQLRQEFYVQGIGGNIDGGTWDKLDDAQRIPFGHVLFWREGERIIVGRLWYSKDGKGRDRYPMGVCALCTGVSVEKVQSEIFPILQRLEEQFKSARRADEISASLKAADNDLNALTPSEAGGDGAAPEPRIDSAPAPNALAYLANRPEFGPDHEGLLRVLYLIEHEMGGFRDGSAAASRTNTLRPQHFRVPVCDDSPERAAARWVELIESQLGSTAPIFACVPLTGGWADLIVGQPAALQLYCLRATPAVLPLSTEIPYNIPSGFVARVQHVLRVANEANTSSPAPSSSEELS